MYLEYISKSPRLFQTTLRKSLFEISFYRINRTALKQWLKTQEITFMNLAKAQSLIRICEMKKLHFMRERSYLRWRENLCFNLFG